MLLLVRRYKILLIALLVTLVILAFLTYSFIAPQGMFSGLKNDLKTIEPSVEFSYTDLDGNTVDLNQFKGKQLIINSWASWIPFSQTELPLLTKVREQYGDRIEVLAINRMEPVGVVRSFLATFSIPTSIIFLLDPSDNFYKAVGGYAMPETLFYNAEGVLIAHKRGVLSEAELDAYVENMLSQQ